MGTVELAGATGYTRAPLMNFFLERYMPAYEAEVRAFVYLACAVLWEQYGGLVPGDFLSHQPAWINFFENPTTVQFAVTAGNGFFPGNVTTTNIATNAQGFAEVTLTQRGDRLDVTLVSGGPGSWRSPCPRRLRWWGPAPSPTASSTRTTSATPARSRFA